MLKVGVLIERNRAYSRRICEGVADFANEIGGWTLKFLEMQDERSLRSVDAFIARVTDRRTAARLSKTGKPVVDVYGAIQTPGFLRVDADHAAIGRMAAAHFIEHKFENCAYCGYDGTPFSDLRREAFVHFLELNHCRCTVYRTPKKAQDYFNSVVIKNEQLLMGPDSRNIREWIRCLPKPVGVFCSHDLRAYQLALICRDASISMPRDVAILGVDNDAILCGFTSPMLSSVDPNAFEIGREAARVLSLAVDRKGSVKAAARVPPAGVVTRASTSVYPLEPEWLSDALVFIRRKVANHLTAADVCTFLGMSHTPVDRVFRRVLDSSVQKEIARVRLDEGRRLLENTRLDVAEVARRAGFASGEYFCNVFRRSFGVSPSDYRRSASNAPSVGAMALRRTACNDGSCTESEEDF